MDQGKTFLVDGLMITKRRPIALLGINMMPLPMDLTLQQIQRLIDRYKKDLRPRYVSTVNVDFIVKVHHTFSSRPRYQSLLKALRDSSISTLDGSPLLWLSRLLGSKVEERVTGADLFPKLSAHIASSKGSIYLLGGEERTLKLCMVYLQSTIPSLRIVGASHPKIFVEGSDLENYEERDDIIVEEINKASPEVLFLNLGNPKQELWFQRVKHKLHVPVTIGVGGSFDLLTGAKKRAPLWMQKLGLEWVYRLLQEPKRLFVRYFFDLIKFPLIALPLVCAHNLNKWSAKLIHKTRMAQTKVRSPLLFIAAHHNLAIVPLPANVSDEVSLEIYRMMEDLFSNDGIVFDFQRTRHLDLEGYALLLNFLKRAAKDKKNLFFLNVNLDLRILLRLHRLWDVASPHLCASPYALLERLARDPSASSLYDSIQQYRNWVVLSFLGRLDHQENYLNYMKKVGPIIYKKDCIIDLSYVSYIDNSGIGFLLKLLTLKPNHINSLKLCGLSRSLKEQLKIEKVYDLFESIPHFDDLFFQNNF